LGAPQAAPAHVRSGIVATEYRATIAPLRPPLRTAISVRIDETDRAVRLTVAPGHSVTVLDRSGEPLLRVDSGRSVVWHDARLRGLPASVDHAGWTVPIILDGARVQLEGDLRRVRAPSAGWWLAIAAVLGAVTVLVLRLRRPSALRTARAFAGLAAVATIAVTVTFALSSSASAGSRFVALDLLVCAGVGIALGRDAAPWRRVGAAAGLGLLAVFVGLLRIPRSARVSCSRHSPRPPPACWSCSPSAPEQARSRQQQSRPPDRADDLPQLRPSRRGRARITVPTSRLHPFQRA
jgi:hypothetical protein